MIEHTLQPLPPVKAEAIRAALNNTDINAYLEVLAARGAGCTASAGVLSLDPTNVDEVIAQVENARFYQRMLETINEDRVSDSRLEALKISVRPFAKTQTQT